MQTRPPSSWGLFTVMAASFGLHPAAAWACSVCTDGSSTLAQALRVSGTFLLAMPFLISGAVIGAVYVAYKRTQRQRQTVPRKSVVGG